MDGNYTGIGIKNAIGFYRRRTGSLAGINIPSNIRESILAWYDPKLQKCTNESLAENPVLKNLSDKKVPDLNLKSFKFEGLSGIGSTAFISYTVIEANIEEVFVDGLKVHIERFNSTVTNSYCVRVNCTGNFKFKISNIKKQDIHRISVVAYRSNESIFLIRNPNEGVYEVNIQDIDLSTFNIYIDVINSSFDFEILPYYKDSLVFNGTAPYWYINKNNATNIGDSLRATWLSNTICNITGTITSSNYIYLDNERFSTDEDTLNVNIPSYTIRVNGLQEGQTVTIYYNRKYENTSHFDARLADLTNGTHIVPETSVTIENANSDYNISYSDFRLVLKRENESISDNVDITIEFIPSYPVPTTGMYGTIPLVQGAKCMMMDFVPISLNTIYYDQRKDSVSNNYAIYNDQNTTAYRERSLYPTYINGVVNTKAKCIDLIQKRQVIGVNAETIDAVDGIYVACSNYIGYISQMALNSLILFDRQLTEDEMKWVMNNLMKFTEQEVYNE